MAKANSRRGGVLHLTKTQYRQFAEQTKQVGLALNVSTFEHMGCWGEYSMWALSVCKDASVAETKWDERSMINLASAVNADKLRSNGEGRPEMDWGALEDHEIYPFIVQHEIGHRQDNFDTWDIIKIEDLAVRNECERRLRYVNELLADRYAWNQIRPGEPLPLNERGREIQRKGCYGLSFLEKHAKKKTPCKPEWRLAPGAYKDVPDYMLASAGRAAFLGPDVDPALVAERTAYYREYHAKRSTRLF